MRTSIKLQRLINKTICYTRHEPILPMRVGEEIKMEKIYCIRESDMPKFIKNIVKLNREALSKGCTL